jgi:hypothetical protein
MTGRGIAALFGVTPQAVGLWHKNNGCPRDKEGRYDLREVIAWRIAWEREQVAGDSQAARDKEISLARKAAADAELREMQLAREKDLIVDKMVMEQREIVIATAFRKWAEGLPRRLRVDTAVQQQLTREIKAGLAEFAQRGLKFWAGAVAKGAK